MHRYYLQDPQYQKNEKLFLAAPTLIDKADATTGIVDAFVSVMGNIDLHDDIIHMGAFTKTIQERTAQGIQVLDNHNFFSVMDVLGKCVGIEERPRRELPGSIQEQFPDAMGGLWTSTQFMLDDDISMRAFRRIKSGAINQYSIGFQIVKEDWETMNLGDDENPLYREIRNIREIRLFEYSPVIFAANTATATEAVKHSFSIPITINSLIAKRAETKTHTCAKCTFFKGFTDNAGFCTKHDATTKNSLICDDFNPLEPIVRTLSDDFQDEFSEFITNFFNSHGIDDEFKSLIPTITKASSAMLPTHIATKPIEPQSKSDSKSNSTPDNEAANENSLTEDERKALILEIKRQELLSRIELEGK